MNAISEYRLCPKCEEKTLYTLTEPRGKFEICENCGHEKLLEKPLIIKFVINIDALKDRAFSGTITVQEANPCQ